MASRQNWRRAIKEKIEDKELQPKVYPHLIILLLLIEFNKKLQQFLTFLTENDWMSSCSTFGKATVQRSSIAIGPLMIGATLLGL